MEHDSFLRPCGRTAVLVPASRAATRCRRLLARFSSVACLRLLVEEAVKGPVLSHAPPSIGENWRLKLDRVSL